MSHPVRKITIEGFRGILSRLELEFVRGGSARSMILYGGNGTGKSSVTDAWEWFFTENIQHLRKEGASHAAFCHRKSAGSGSYVEIEFSGAPSHAVRQTYDHNRITRPIVTGNISSIKESAPHPCQIRFGDLTRFVYLTRSNRFDELAKLMGFVPQVDYLKALRRTARRFAETLAAKERVLSESVESLEDKLGLHQFNEERFWKALSELLKGVGVACGEDSATIGPAIDELKRKVTEDETARRLSSLKHIMTALAKLETPASLVTHFGDYSKKAEVLIEEQESLQKLVMANLYSAAETILESAKDLTICPLCGATFKEGDLYAHVKEQHRLLDEVVQKKAALDTVRGHFETIASSLLDSRKTMKDLIADLAAAGFDDQIDPFSDSSQSLSGELTKAVGLVTKSVETAKPDHVKLLVNQGITLKASVASSESTRKSLEKTITKIVDNLEADTSRVKLVDAHDVVTWCLSMWETIASLQTSITKMQNVQQEFDSIVQDYVSQSTNDVDTRFQLISQDVDKYFSILEQHTSEIGSPKLVLLTDQDRSVELEVMFQGEAIMPAYKYLSESQLNSFGLAVFLASTRQFNQDFKFVMLDDIINSFDAYKRPQVIKLLQEEFTDFQVLLLTHDEVWRDRLYRALPSWARTEFYDYAPSRGPLQREGVAEVERIQQMLREDRPTTAGRELGPYMEQQLQAICESFEVQLKYNRKNEYTLEPLFNGLKSRIVKKLGRNHELSNLLDAAWQEEVFRNYCAHWKEPSSSYTKPELEMILNNWLEVERLVYCSRESCGQILRYDGQGSFICPCTNAKLEKNAEA